MATVKSEPLTYHRHGSASYFGDRITRDVNRDAEARLDRHAAEQRVIQKEQDERARRAMEAGEFEYRVEPNRTDGQGGYFSPPSWLVNLFATAKRPGRVLASLIPNAFVLPGGISSVNLPILSTGTTAAPVADITPPADTDIVDTAGSSGVVTIAGQADVPLQMLEQSPVPAALDWAIFTDLADSSDANLETQLLAGTGATYNQLVGVTNVSGITSLTYSAGSPTASGMWPFFGQGSAQLGDNRLRPPQAWLMRTSRWSWLQSAEDTGNRPFGLSSPFFMGSDDETPDPVGGLISWPVFLDDALPANLGTAGNQDTVICLRPSDLILFEGPPQTNVYREPLSGNLSARIQMHTRVAAITSRYPSGIVQLGGSGFAVQSGY